MFVYFIMFPYLFTTSRAALVRECPCGSSFSAITRKHRNATTRRLVELYILLWDGRAEDVSLLASTVAAHLSHVVGRASCDVACAASFDHL